MLLLKLLLVPTFLAGVSLAARRWGPGIAGWLAGFPLVTGTILLFLSIENDAGFVVGAATASAAGVAGSALFNLAYAWIASRNPWPAAIAGSLAAWAALAFALTFLPATLPAAIAAALPCILLMPKFFPPVPGPVGSGALPRGEIFARMAAGAGMTVLVTLLAEMLGATWTGLLSVFPTLGVVLSTFSHRANGAAFTVVLLRSMFFGQYAIVAFCAAVALLLPAHGVAVTFVAALAFAMGTHVAVTFALKRR